MAAAATMHSGGRIIDTWVESCPNCRHDVAVATVGMEVRCGKCRETFRTLGAGTRPAAPVALDTPTRIEDLSPRLPRDPNDSLVGTTLGRWTLLRLIGKGGMGRVYEARDGSKDRRVALKVLSEDLASDAHFVKRFHREARLLSSLSHPHIVNVIDQGTEGERLWFAMDYVRGESLRHLIDRGTLDAARATDIASQIAEALAYAHERGIIHRDLKPENVLFDEQGGVHLVDFGLSRLVDLSPGGGTTRLTRTDVILGTYEYMAPEQRRGERSLDGRCDIFALGVILYEMLTGSLPLGRFTPPSQSAKGIARSFDDVVNRALATNKADRFADAASFRDALRAAPTQVPPLPPPLRKRMPSAPVVPHHEVEEARSILKHVEIIGALDRVCGIIVLLGGLSLFPLSSVIMAPAWIPSLGGIFAIILGLYLLGLGKRIGRLQQGARESQITVSVLMLFLPPFVMALGIYSLIVMTSERARNAFRYGAKALRGPDPVFEVHTRASIADEHLPRRPRSATWLMRGFTLVAIFFSVYLALIAVDVYSDAWVYGSTLAEYESLLTGAIAATIYSILVLFRMFLLRRHRRGLGLAVAATLFLFLATSVLNLALTDAQRRQTESKQGAAVRFLPDASPLRHHLRPFLQWENSK
jgi:predicted Ser/Thr protein kinase